MAEFTHSKTIIEQLEDAITKLTNHQISLSDTLHVVALKLEQLLHQMPSPDVYHHSPSSSSANPSSSSPSYAHRMKLEIPCFDGSDALGWIFKITQVF